MLYFDHMTKNLGYLINEQDIESALLYLITNENKNATKEDAIRFLEENAKMSHIIARKIVADEQSGKIKKVNLNKIEKSLNRNNIK